MIAHTLLNCIVPVIKPLERRLLESLASRLELEARRILHSQIASINMVQRHTDCKELCFYRMKWGKPTANPRQAFPLNADEIKLASATFTVPDCSTTFQVDFWLVQGFLFSMTFDQSPKTYLKAETVQIERLDVHHDPMQAIPGIEKRKSEVHLSGWLADWNSQHPLSNLSAPLAPQDRERICNGIPAVLPKDYLDLVSQTEGATIGPCTIYGLYAIRQVVLSDATYFILAETQNVGAIAVKHSATNAVLYICDYNGSTPSPDGDSIRAAVDQSLKAEQGHSSKARIFQGARAGSQPLK